MDKALRWFINGWMAVALLVNILSIVGIFLGAATMSDGLAQVRDAYSPLNVATLFMEALLFSPVIVAAYWRAKRKKSNNR